MKAASNLESGERSTRDASFSVPATAQSAHTARRQLRSQLRRWGLPVDLDSAELLLSEVVTNAIIHGVDPETAEAVITVELSETASGLRVDVHDPDHREAPSRLIAPACAQPEDLPESGHGLALVDALAATWGVRRHGCGKSVYFVVACDRADREPGGRP